MICRCLAELRCVLKGGRHGENRVKKTTGHTHSPSSSLQGTMQETPVFWRRGWCASGWAISRKKQLQSRINTSSDLVSKTEKILSHFY